MAKFDTSKMQLEEKMVTIRRVAKTVKGGRNVRFSVTMVVGDGEGHVGVGTGKALEIPEAARIFRDLLRSFCSSSVSSLPSSTSDPANGNAL